MLRLGLAISALVHTGALAYVVSRPAPSPPPEPPAPIPIEIVDATPPPPESPPIDVAVLDARQIAALTPSPVTPAPAPAAAHRDRERPTAATAATAAIIASTGSGVPVPAREQPGGTEPGRGTSLMAMRQPGSELDLQHPGTRFDDLEHVPQGTNAVRDERSGRLAPAGGGSYRSEEGPFVATVNPDGTVKLKDKKNLHLHFGPPGAKDIGNGISAWYNDDSKPVGTLAPQPGERIALNNDNLEDNFKRPDSGGTVPIIGGGFDVTDAFMRSHGQDPYASRKLAYLDATRDERVQIGAKHRQQQLAKATQIMQKNLDRLWARVVEPGARKQALFELWDECAESGATDLVTAGADARKLVVGFIRARLPAGSPDAYTHDELASFNRRKQSRATFAPYD